MTVNAHKLVTFCLQSSRSHHSAVLPQYEQAADMNGFLIDLRVISGLQKIWCLFLTLQQRVFKHLMTLDPSQTTGILYNVK